MRLQHVTLILVVVLTKTVNLPTTYLFLTFEDPLKVFYTDIKQLIRKVCVHSIRLTTDQSLLISPKKSPTDSKENDSGVTVGSQRRPHHQRWFQ